ncbi:cadherin-like and PC-esterase domain-containing protein 1 [Electrophorus electricus]|uniref:cadherin-like and PC-esterase domain-containing protein 1 n=1 Tax=Electrophorus electricus TaxID=8005 RepID=UPI0015CFD3C7|nr:cadherin-like and PC-esterase domain-containing protein 1 [Electrophorus electricus]
MLLRRTWTLRRKCCTGPLLLLGIAVFLVYQTLVVDRSWFRPVQANRRNKSVMSERDHTLLLKDPEQLGSLLEMLRANHKVRGPKRGCVERAIVLAGQHVPSDTEVQLYWRVLQEQGYHVEQGRYAETSNSFRRDLTDGREWSLLICLKDSEKSCLRKISVAHPQPYQKVNIIPAFVGAFFDMGGTCRFLMDSRLSGLSLPIIPSACAPSRLDQEGTPHRTGNEGSLRAQSSPLANQGLVATVNVYVMVTSVMPLTAFIHHTGLVRTHLEKNSYPTKLLGFFTERLGPTLCLPAYEHMNQVIDDVLTAAVLATAESSSQRCRLCFQMLTFTLHYDASVYPVVVKVQTGLCFDGMKDPDFDGQITKEYILEDMLKLLFPPCTSENSSQSAEDATIIKSGGCERSNGLCVAADELQILLQFYEQLTRPGSFDMLFPRSSHFSDLQHDLIQRFPGAAHSGMGAGLMVLLEGLSSSYTLRIPTESKDDSASLGHKKWSPDPSESERCAEPHLRQIYTDPPLLLTPPFKPWVKEYHSEVPFDIITIRIRPEPTSMHCRVRLDDHNGPRMANYPIGLGNSRINILVMDESGMEPVVITIYTLHIFRESRPSLPMFDEYVMCGFIQDCGLVVRPNQPCGLEPALGLGSSGKPQAAQPCPSGDQPGRWVVPCLSCSDNRTCDWREVTWQPDYCYHPLLKQPQLQKCMMDRKVLFIGDSTNRGMMYYLMERVNTTLEDWDKAHDTIVYHNVNQGRTLISYSYYPQFWLHTSQRPTFQTALQQLIERSRPLENSPQTVLVAGGVQWFSLEHLKTIQQVLQRERLQKIVVVVKSLGLGFHLPVDGIHSLSLTGLQKLDSVNKNILDSAKRFGYEVVDTFSITMGRYKEFLQGRCVCHFHEVGKPSLPTVPAHRWHARESLGGVSVGGTSVQQAGDWAQRSVSYHVMGAVNQVYSEILLSRVCASYVRNANTYQHVHRLS